LKEGRNGKGRERKDTGGHKQASDSSDRTREVEVHGPGHGHDDKIKHGGVQIGENSAGGAGVQGQEARKKNKGASLYRPFTVSTKSKGKWGGHIEGPADSHARTSCHRLLHKNEGAKAGCSPRESKDSARKRGSRKSQAREFIAQEECQCTGRRCGAWRPLGRTLGGEWRGRAVDVEELAPPRRGPARVYSMLSGTRHGPHRKPFLGSREPQLGRRNGGGPRLPQPDKEGSQGERRPREENATSEQAFPRSIHPTPSVRAPRARCMYPRPFLPRRALHLEGGPPPRTRLIFQGGGGRASPRSFLTTR